MSKHVSLSCNLCGQNKSASDLLGIWWEYSAAGKRDEISERHPNETDNHICWNCAEQIARAVNRRKK